MNETKKVLVPVSDDVEELEMIGITDTLRRAGANVTIAAIDQLQIQATNGLKFIADKMLDDCANEIYDLIVLPGGYGVEKLRDNHTLISLLKKQQEEGRLIGAICAAPVVILQHHGLLKNYQATCYPTMAAQLKTDSYCADRVVVDKNLITSQGPGTVLEFAIKLVELLFDKNTAQKIAKQMVI